MRELFVQVLNASFSGSIVIGAVIVLRLALKKAPKKYICLLWLLAGARLLMPFEIESSLSLQPQVEPVTESQWVELEDYGRILEPGEPIDTGELEWLQEAPASQNGEDVTAEVSYTLNWPTLLPYLWLAGAAAMGLYTAVSYLRLCRRVKDSVILSEGVWVSGKLDSSFVLGLFRPRIYLNAGLTGQEQTYVLAHERCHIRRGDPVWKLVMFLALAVHWFNPAVWAAYILLCRDLEMACDEAVVRTMDVSQRKAYSAALLRCSARSRTIAACPVAFGEVSVKQRIQNVLNYRKKSFWIVLASLLAVVVVAVCFLTSPAGANPVTIWDIQNVTDTSVVSEVGIYCPGTEEEIQKVVDALKAVRCSRSPLAEEAPVEEFWIELEGSANIDTVCFAEDFSLVWGRLGEETTAVYGVENPEGMKALKEAVYDGVNWRNATAEPFAGVDVPLEWARGLSLDAVEAAYVRRTAAESTAGGVMSTARFEELVSVLNGLTQDAFSEEKTLANVTYQDITGRHGENTHVRILDGANQLYAVLLLAPDDTMELFLTDEMEKMDEMNRESLTVRYWVIQDDTLLAYMRQLRESPSYIMYATWYQEQMDSARTVLP